MGLASSSRSSAVAFAKDEEEKAFKGVCGAVVPPALYPFGSINTAAGCGRQEGPGRARAGSQVGPGGSGGACLPSLLEPDQQGGHNPTSLPAGASLPALLLARNLALSPSSMAFWVSPAYC